MSQKLIFAIALTFGMGFSQSVSVANYFQYGGSLPATCDPGNVFIATGGVTSICYQQNLWQTVSSSGTASSGLYASLPTCNSGATGSTYQFTDSSYDLATCNGSAWTITRHGIALTPPPTGSWTADNSGAFSFVNGFGHLTGATSGGAVNMRGQFRTAPTAPYTLTAAVDGLPYTNGADAVGYSLVFRDGTGKIVGFLFGHDGSGFFMQDDKWTSSTSFSAAYLKTNNPQVGMIQGLQPQWIRVQDNSAGNLIFCTSFDGINWTQFDTARARTDFFGAGGPTQIGFYVYTNGGAVAMNLSSWATVGTAPSGTPCLP